jgi:membrane protease YdiL (CAAX protease family)
MVELNGATSRWRLFLLLEFLGFFLVVPFLLYFWVPLPILPFLWAFAAWCGRALMKDHEFDRANLWRASALTGGGKSIFIHSALCAVALFALISFLAPHLLFLLVKQKPLLWLLIVVLYPLLSVYPQELIYRAYFFHRYSPLFPNKRLLLVLNGLLFGYVHVVFHNWVAVGLTVAGGIAFALTYERHRSILLVSLEHSLFGALLFTLGLGQFFYTGTISTISRGLRL